MLCVGVLGMWVRSLWRFDAYSFRAYGCSMSISTPRHALGLEGIDKPGYYSFNTRGWSSHSALDNATVDEFLGFRIERGRLDYRRYCGLGFKFRPLWHDWQGTSLALHVPFWFLALLFALVPVQWARSTRRMRRTSRGQCAKCGYDLRASPTRCPECGNIAKPAAQTAA
ncbi:MAG: hypothetical protein QOF78_1962 [Phycisphaerales bacterium]|nr:hypothetical protein [Phycisphaerales bacterium]